MIKKLFSVIALLLVLTPFSVSSIHAASNNPTSIVLEKDQVVNHDYFAAGGSVSIHGTVNGEAFLFGGNINIDGTINGDLFVFGGTVTVSGTVKNDLRVAGGTVVVEGTIGGSVLAGGGNVTLSSSSHVAGSLVAGAGSLTVNTPISKNVWVGGGQTNLNNKLSSDVNVGGGEITLDSGADIEGNLNYWSSNKIKINQGATVSGTVTQHLVDQPNRKAFLGVFGGLGVFSKVVSTISLIIIGLLLLRFFPKTTIAISKEVESKLFPSLGWGFAFLIINFFLSLVFILFIVGIPLGLILLSTTLILAFISQIFVGLWLGRKLFTSFDKSKNYLWALVLGVTIYQIITMLPIIGWLVHLLSVVIGVGASLRVKKATYESLRTSL